MVKVWAVVVLCVMVIVAMTPCSTTLYLSKVVCRIVEFIADTTAAVVTLLNCPTTSTMVT